MSRTHHSLLPPPPTQDASQPSDKTDVTKHTTDIDTKHTPTPEHSTPPENEIDGESPSDVADADLSEDAHQAQDALDSDTEADTLEDLVAPEDLTPADAQQNTDTDNDGTETPDCDFNSDASIDAGPDLSPDPELVYKAQNDDQTTLAIARVSPDTLATRDGQPVTTPAGATHVRLPLVFETRPSVTFSVRRP